MHVYPLIYMYRVACFLLITRLAHFSLALSHAPPSLLLNRPRLVPPTT